MFDPTMNSLCEALSSKTYWISCKTTLPNPSLQQVGGSHMHPTRDMPPYF
jgi:hypothetical protein